MNKCLAVSLLLIAAKAHAEPALVAAAAEPPAPPMIYVQAGAMAGVNGLMGNDGQLIMAGTVDGGVRLAGKLWAHAMVADGTNISLNTNASFRQLRVGGEARLGAYDDGRTGRLYALVGADVGMQRIHSESIYWDGTPPDNMRVVDQTVVIPRIGIGGANQHLQAGVVAELALDGGLPDGFDLIGTLGARF